MRKLKFRTLSVCLVVAVLCSHASLFGGLSVNANAASNSDINSQSVFLKQHTSITCTLASAAMLMRRTAIAAGYLDWEEITEENIKDKGWVDGLGLLWNFSCYNMKMGHGYFSGNDNRTSIIELLEKYPQGIVVYNGGNKGQSHAVLLTDYDVEKDIFYIADPANSAPSGRITLNESTIVGSNQGEKLANFTAYWFISTPSIAFKDGVYSVISTTGPVADSESGQSSYDPESDAAIFNSSCVSVNEYYVVTDGAEKGAAMRYYPSGSSSEYGYLSKNSIVFVKYKGKNNFGAQWYKLSTGYYVFSGNLTSFSDYSQEVKKFENTLQPVEKTFTVKPVNDTKTALRIEPSEGNNIIGYADEKTHLYITETGVNSQGAKWYYTSDGYYVKACDMTSVTESNVSAVGYEGDIGVVSGIYSSSPIADEIESEVLSDSYEVTATWLNMRKVPVDGEVIASIKLGTVITVSEVNSGWGKTYFEEKNGWVSMDYLKSTEAKTESLKITDIKISADTVKSGAEVGCTIRSSGGAGSYVYTVNVNDADGKSVYSDTGSGSTYKYKSNKTGTYYFSVTVTDKENNSLTAYSSSFTVYRPLQIEKITCDVDEYMYVFTQINWTVHALQSSDSTNYVYTIACDGETVKHGVSKSEIITYTPEKAGHYMLDVYLQDSFTISDAVSAGPVLVYDNLSISSIKLNSTAAIIGDKIECKIEASGGTGDYTYCFSVFNESRVIKNGSFGKSDSNEYIFSEKGTYKFFCAVLDSGNNMISSFSADIIVTDSLRGDIDGNGSITSSDARIVLLYSCGLNELSENELKLADVTEDGVVTATDARLILRCSAGLEK